MIIIGNKLQVIKQNIPTYHQPTDPYNFEIRVSDEDSGNYQGRYEWVDSEGVTRGWYTVVLPDGFLYNYTYTSSPSTGYQVHPYISWIYTI